MRDRYSGEADCFAEHHNGDDDERREPGIGQRSGGRSQWMWRGRCPRMIRDLVNMRVEERMVLNGDREDSMVILCEYHEYRNWRFTFLNN